MFDSLWPHGLDSSWNSSGQNTGVGSLSLLQGIFPTQGLNPGLLHYRQILYQLSHKGSPRILQWVAYLFSSGSSRPRNRTRVSCIAGGWYFIVVLICILLLFNLWFSLGWCMMLVPLSTQVTQYSGWTPSKIVCTRFSVMCPRITDLDTVRMPSCYRCF